MYIKNKVIQRSPTDCPRENSGGSRENFVGLRVQKSIQRISP